MPPKIEVAGKSDIGLVRSGNEDFLHIDKPNCVFAVCDGMGGHQAGEIASMTASEIICTVFSKMCDDILGDSRLHPGRTLPPSGDLLIKSIRLANRAIHNRSHSEAAHSGMGTTVVAVALEADIMSVAHVGDSRAYRLRDDKLEPLTRDHSWVAEMEESNQIAVTESDSMVGKNIITRALGVKEAVEVDFRIIKVKAGDRFVLCSDGLCGFVTDEEIFAEAKKAGDDIEKVTDTLIQMANDRGGTDNVTVITLKVIEIEESPLPEVEMFTLENESTELLAVEDNILGHLQMIQNEARETSEKSGVSEEVEEGANKIVLIAIFVLFVGVAAAVIYYTQNP